MSDPAPAAGPAVQAAGIAAAVTAQPEVVRLDGGVFGATATYLPGRKLVGVYVPEDPAAAVEVAVVLALGRPIPQVVAELRERVAAVAGGRPVDVTVADVTLAGVPLTGTPTADTPAADTGATPP